ncbi:MAG: ATP-binding protein [Candidatus Uhrbacteria bacterium]|nr:ATP-binding protein [Candidatus Uhrbacteria bacterium]
MIDKQSIKITKELLSSVLKEQRDAFANKDVGVQREVLKSLSDIVKTPQIIVITGLRRVGKSTLMAQVAQKYLGDDFYFINFEDERLLNFSVGDFDFLYETLISLFGEKKTFLFDEIQNVPQWERFVRRMHDQGYKFIVTGSNASLLSQELGTRLTGRSVRIELYPFSFREFLTFKDVIIPNVNIFTTREKGKLLKLSDEYLISGGIPDALKYPKLDIHKTLYDDVLYRDIATRYQIDNVKELKELAFFLISNISSLISYNKLKDLLKLGSVNTVKSYIDYLESSWLFFIVNKYAYSVKEQQIAAKKIYSIDTGLARTVGFSFSENKGKLMENLVFLNQRKRGHEIYYYKTKQDHEVDFFLPHSKTFIQVAQHVDNEATKKREIQALVEAAKEHKKENDLIIVTEREKETIKEGKIFIQVVPLYEWLLME